MLLQGSLLSALAGMGTGASDGGCFLRTQLEKTGMKIIQNDVNSELCIGEDMVNNKSLACVALFSVWKTSLQGRTRAFLHGNETRITLVRPQKCQTKLKKEKADDC